VYFSDLLSVVLVQLKRQKVAFRSHCVSVADVYYLKLFILYIGLVYAEEEEVAASTGASANTEAVEAADSKAASSASYIPPENAKKYAFEAEVHRMLDIVVNSLYQNKDVFLRELISNAADAIDKYRYMSLTHPDEYGNASDDDSGGTPDELAIQVEFDTTANTLTVRDNGIGMTKDDMIENLGTVARSGTTRFLQALQESNKNGDKQATDATIQQIG
jgi:Histidine kinase-, DNA gyrase B-, and HSP90-like ATPase